MPFNGDRDEMTAIHIMEESLKAPFVQILENGGNDSDIVIDNIIDKEYGYGYDVKAEKYGNMLQMGIIDPAKVTKSALRNAVSVANTIMMCETTITNKIKS
jgi:chaperonin GroEL